MGMANNVTLLFEKSKRLCAKGCNTCDERENPRLSACSSNPRHIFFLRPQPFSNTRWNIDFRNGRVLEVLLDVELKVGSMVITNWQKDLVSWSGVVGKYIHLQKRKGQFLRNVLFGITYFVYPNPNQWSVCLHPNPTVWVAHTENSPHPNFVECNLEWMTWQTVCILRDMLHVTLPYPT